jgi:hypothetical protein
MGLTFGDIEKEQLGRLEAWLGPLRERDWLVQKPSKNKTGHCESSCSDFRSERSRVSI